jgi:hypothetical protein
VRAALGQVGNATVVVLAQASMAAAADGAPDGLSVLSSPRTGLRAAIALH